MSDRFGLFLKSVPAVCLLLLSPVIELDAGSLGEASMAPQECWFEIADPDARTECFYVVVPENHKDPDVREILFPLVYFPAMDPVPGNSPVLHLGGGGPGNPIGFWPGADASWLYQMYREFSVDDGRDLYIIDPRGVGHTEPVLNCYEYVDAAEFALAHNLKGKEENQIAIAAYQACRARLVSSGIDLNQYHSANVARDVELLRNALGVAHWNLYGVSYGSRYAQTIARDYPDTVESMVLDAATFMDINYTERTARDYELALNRMFEHCDGSLTCRLSLGNPRERVYRLVSQLNDQPLEFVLVHPFTEDEITVVLNGARFLNAYYNALYYSDYYGTLPNVVKSLEDGKLGRFREILQDWLGYVLDRDYSDGSAISHYCYEEAPFVDFDQARSNAGDAPKIIREMIVDGLDYSEAVCALWDIEPAPAVESAPMDTKVPTLFLHGSLDPVLPVEDLAHQAENFDNSALSVFPGVSHTVIGFDECVTDTVRAFYGHKLDYKQYETCSH